MDLVANKQSQDEYQSRGVALACEDEKKTWGGYHHPPNDS